MLWLCLCMTWNIHVYITCLHETVLYNVSIYEQQTVVNGIDTTIFDCICAKYGLSVTKIHAYAFTADSNNLILVHVHHTYAHIILFNIRCGKRKQKNEGRIAFYFIISKNKYFDLLYVLWFTLLGLVFVSFQFHICKKKRLNAFYISLSDLYRW